MKFTIPVNTTLRLYDARGAFVGRIKSTKECQYDSTELGDIHAFYLMRKVSVNLRQKLEQRRHCYKFDKPVRYNGKTYSAFFGTHTDPLVAWMVFEKKDVTTIED